MTERKKRVTLTTPRGVFLFPKLTAPDFGNQKFPKPNGEYSVQMILKADEASTKAFLKKLQPYYDEAMEEAAEAFKALKVDVRKKLGKVTENDLFTTIYDQETEEPTGEIKFKFAMTASGVRKDKTKWSAKPGIFDAKGKPMVKAPDIWSGTVGIVSFQPSAYFIPGTGAAGLKLGLAAAQIIDLVSNGSRSASSYGFGEEDGYEYDEADAADNDDDDDAGDDQNSGSSKDIDDDIPF